jgi:hypothetical protein
MNFRGNMNLKMDQKKLEERIKNFKMYIESSKSINQFNEDGEPNEKIL